MLKSIFYAQKTFSFLHDLKEKMNPDDHLRIKQRLLEHLASERGIWLKIVQLVEGQGDQWDLAEIEKGQIKALSFEVIQEILKTAYGENLNKIFSFVEEQGKSASFSQVHRAVLVEGGEVALKIQYPFMKEKLQEQLQVLKLSSIFEWIGPGRKWGIDLEAYRKYLSESLLNELNYEQEKNNLLLMREISHYCSWVIIPEVREELCYAEILAMSWEKGEVISDVASSWPLEKRQELGQKIFKSFFESFFKLGLLQSDPNDGNFLYRLNQQQVEVVWIDFGAIHSFSTNFRSAVATLLSLDQNQVIQSDLLPLFTDLGFDQQKLKHIEPCLQAIVSILLEGLHAEYPFSFADWELKEKLDRALGDYKWWFRSAGGIDFFVLMKSFLVVKNHLSQLKVNIRTGALLEEVLKGVPKIPLQMRDQGTNILPDRMIRLSVTDQGIEKVQMSLPLTSLWGLPDLMEGDLASKLEARGINLKELIQEVTREGLPSKTLFELEDHSKRVKVWIE